MHLLHGVGHRLVRRVLGCGGPGDGDLPPNDLEQRLGRSAPVVGPPHGLHDGLARPQSVTRLIRAEQAGHDRRQPGGDHGDGQPLPPAEAPPACARGAPLLHGASFAQPSRVASVPVPDPTRAGPAGGPLPDGRTVQLATLASAVHSTREARRLTAELAAAGVPAMVLRGPPVQRWLLGSDAVYRSADVDLLIRPEHRRLALAVLHRTRWQFLTTNGVLWRLDRAAAFTRSGVTVDLHWGLHAFWVSPRHLRPLERALWAGATPTPDGWSLPRPEPLAVYLAVHEAAAGYHKHDSLALLRAASDLATDRASVEALARSVHVWSTVQHAVDRARNGATGPAPPLFDGTVHRLLARARKRARAVSAVPTVRRAVLAARRWRQRPV